MNIALRLTQNAKDFPDKKAVIFPQYNNKLKKYDYLSITFKELDVLSNKFAHQLEKLGLKKGDRTLLFLRPSLDFSAMTFALFKLGVIPVFIDPGMGRKNLFKCIQEARPVCLIAEKEVHYIRIIFRKIFKTVKFNVTNGDLTWGKMIKISKMKNEKIQFYKGVTFQPNDTAAILYTSGGTGAPKGVVYSHFIFDQQTTILKDLYKLTNTDIDMAGFPLFSLFSIAMGMTSCIPDMDPSKPSSCDPKKLYQNIVDQKPTFLAGSPAIWERLADYCQLNNLTLDSVKYVVMFGAPVAVAIHKKFKSLLPNGTTYTPYGATEVLPVSSISGEYILKNTAHLTNQGKGTCIGNIVEGNSVRIIKITDDVISSFSETKILEANQIGEIVVSGPTVTKEYLDLPEKTLEAKIIENNVIWHRMGDIGYIDENGLIWFLGRKVHRVESSLGLMTPISCEAIFNGHPAVKRSALVGLGKIGSQIPAIVIERHDGEFLLGKERSLFESELMALGKRFSHTQMIQKIYLSKNFPVDVRHNIKIDRTKLKEEIEDHDIS
jgi:acyl-CoA synthetase (AMP-forming)/AMP-acid ligase II